MSFPAMNRDDMSEIKQSIRDVGDELAGKIQTSRMREIARESVHSGLKDVFGVDSDITGEVRDVRASMAFVRSFRRASEKVGMSIILTLASILTVGVAAAIWRGLK